MVTNILKSVFAGTNERYLRSLTPIVRQINELEDQIIALNDQELRAQTDKLKAELKAGSTLDDILPEAFATVREAAKRTLGMRHYDVQLIGGMVLHRGQIAEMKTGEGKTLVATLPAYLNALTEKGVHIVTVNDYLAKRDAEWMGVVYRFLGLEVGVVHSGMADEDKIAAYQADITFGENNEFGFDYLRDNLKFAKSSLYQRGHNFAIVDEVDSILIDEARTPLIISGAAEDSSELYKKVNQIIPKLKEGEDYEIELKTKNPTLTDEGVAHAEKLLSVGNLYDPSNIEILHHVNQSLRAHTIMIKDVDYVVKNGEIIIVDEFTGRLMSGRRWSDGLHQAVEAKEGVKIAPENTTLASITYQNFFRLYSKLSGMTGTAYTEAEEFNSIYNLDVVVIPTNLPIARADDPDVIYRSIPEKYAAVIEQVVECHEKGQPVLVGTISIEQSESLSAALKQRKIPHSVLNAKFHESEAQIVAQAGRSGAVTIATNMAGRGTDIVLGGNPEFLASAEVSETGDEYEETLAKYKTLCAEDKQKVLDAGGLFIIGTERHESRRIDNQLRGRSGRQGDPGMSRFYISLDDDLMKRFGGDRYQGLMQKMGWKEGLAIDSRVISKTIEKAQSRVERQHFEGRKHVTEYDDVLNRQRQAVYALRAKIREGEDLTEDVLVMIDDYVEAVTLKVCNEEVKPPLWKLEEIPEVLNKTTGLELTVPEDIERDPQVIFDHYRKLVKDAYLKHAEEQAEGYNEIADSEDALQLSFTEDGEPFDYTFETIEQEILLKNLDKLWNQHLKQMEFLREGIGLRSYGQKNPLHEYQQEGFELFSIMLDSYKEQVIHHLFFSSYEDIKKIEQEIRAEQARRAAIEKQVELATKQEEEKQKKLAESYAPKNPDDEREKLKERRKKRRKRK